MVLPGSSILHLLGYYVLQKDERHLDGTQVYTEYVRITVHERSIYFESAAPITESRKCCSDSHLSRGIEDVPLKMISSWP